MTLRPLEPGDRPMIEALLAENPFKREQIDFQRLDRGRLVAFHLDRTMRRVGQEESPAWVVETNGNGGVFGFQKSRKHSDFFGKLVFTIDPVISYKLDRKDIAKALAFLQSRMVSLGAEVIWGQCDEADATLVQSFGRAGGDYCGTSLRMTHWLETSRPQASPSKGVSIRRAQHGDRGELRRIATQSHRHSRFFRDPHLPEERKSDLFPDYLEECLDRDRGPCLVAVDEAGGVCGFSLLLCPQGQEESIGRRIGIVDFIAVDPSRQGRKIGGALLGESLSLLRKEGYELVELKTQLDNRGAIGFYSQWGFRPISAEMHFSFGEGGA